MFKYLKSAATMLAAASICQMAAAKLPAYTNPAGNEFPIVGWYSIPDSASTPERYREMREAGFNISFPHLKNNEEVAKAVEASRGTGVRIIVMSDDVYSDPEGTAERFRGEPQIAGWYLRDEPVASQFGELAELRDRIYAADTTRMIYLNLFPNIMPPEMLKTGSYDEYMQRFLDEVRPQMLSFDHYPILFNDSTRTAAVRPEFYANLESGRRVASANQCPLWAFCLSTAHLSYPLPRDSHLRLEAFAALAYGAQGIQHFTYWEPLTEPDIFYHGPIDRNGQRTDVYHQLKSLNKEIQDLAPIFLGSEVLGVWHTGNAIPEGTTRFPISERPAGLQKLHSDGEGLLVSHLRGGDGNEYVMLVNRDIVHAQKVSAQFKGNVSAVTADGKPRTLSETESIEPGSYLLIRLS